MHAVAAAAAAAVDSPHGIANHGGKPAAQHAQGCMYQQTLTQANSQAQPETASATHLGNWNSAPMTFGASSSTPASLTMRGLLSSAAAPSA